MIAGPLDCEKVQRTRNDGGEAPTARSINPELHGTNTSSPLVASPPKDRPGRRSPLELPTDATQMRLT